MKKTLEVLAKWYKNGWLDKEFIVKDGNKVIETVTRGNFLAYKGMWWNVWWPFPDLWKNVADAEIEYFPVLKGPDGKAGLAVDSTNFYGVAISTKCQNPEALVYLYNEEMDSLYRNSINDVEKQLHDAMDSAGYKFKYPPEEKQDPLNPEEKETYKKKYDYKTVGYGFFNDYETHDNLTFGFKGRIPIEATVRFAAVSKSYVDGRNGTDLPKEYKIEYDNFNTEPKRMAASSPNILNWMEYEKSGELHPNMFVGAPTPAMVEKKTYLDKLENETFVKIIMGKKSIDEFEQFVTEWNKNGGEQITKEVNDWYRSTK